MPTAVEGIRIFSSSAPGSIGSMATRYVRTKEFEQEVNDVDLRIMTVSGAAVSSYIGSNMRALAPTLSILNVRLGYWIKNPRQLARDRVVASLIDQLYFLQELCGLMRATETIYLTDGDILSLLACTSCYGDAAS